MTAKRTICPCLPRSSTLIDECIVLPVKPRHHLTMQCKPVCHSVQRAETARMSLTEIARQVTPPPT